MINEIKDIPTLPQVTVELIQQAFQDEPDIKEIASTINKDATLAAKLLKTVNSAAYGPAVAIKSIAQAVSLLGLNSLRSTIVSIALGDYFIKSSFGNTLDVKRYCSHSLATAILMREMAHALDAHDTDQLYLLGLLHDLGKLAMDTFENHDYSEVLKSVDGGETFIEAERRIYGRDHLQAWMDIARSWNFPPKIIDLYQGSVEGKSTFSTQKLIEAASDTADTLGYYFTEPCPGGIEIDSDILSALSEQTLLEICASVQGKSEAIGRILDLPSPDGKQIQQTLLKTTHRLSRTSNQLAVANSEYQRIHNELILRVEVLEQLARVFTGIIKNLDGPSLNFSVLEALIEGFSVNGAFILLCHDNGKLTGYAARSNFLGDARIEEIRFSNQRPSPSMQECLENRSPVKVNNPLDESVLKKLLGTVSLAWLVPVCIKDRSAAILGVGVRDRQSQKFNNEDFGKILNIISGEVGLSMENSRLYHRIRKDAITDPLTKIGSRRYIMKVLASEFARFKRKLTPLSVAIFDMDNFKQLNDSRGHLAGDEFLAGTAQRLKNGIRESDYIGRYGGDEFIAVLPNTTVENARVVVERIRERLLEFCDAYETADTGNKLSTSVGLAGASPYMTEPDQLIHLADQALYKAKEAGRNRCVCLDDLDAMVKT